MAVPTISGASHDHEDDWHIGAESEVPGEERQIWPDITRKEALTLVPLVLLTIYIGVYPQSVLNICEPALQRILDMVVR
jgi:NADH:ubiquinone oxidoreductase subunit 4 (subunit M)